MIGRVAFGVYVLALASCVKSEVTRTGGGDYPPRGSGCIVQVLPSTIPEFQYVEVATGEVKCHFSHGRSACIDQLKEDACGLGAHAVFGFREGSKASITSSRRALP